VCTDTLYYYLNRDSGPFNYLFWHNVWFIHTETNCTEYSSFRTARSRPASQKIPCTLWSQKFSNEFTGSHYQTPFWERLLQFTLAHTISTSILILSPHQRLGLPSSLFHSDFPANFLYFLCACYMPIHQHPYFYRHINIQWKVKIMKFLITQVSSATCPSPFLHPSYILNPVSANILSSKTDNDRKETYMDQKHDIRYYEIYRIFDNLRYAPGEGNHFCCFCELVSVG
jgi:hypothetical protein